MPEELKKEWLELGERIFSAGKERGKKIIANAMLKVAGEEPAAEEGEAEKGAEAPPVGAPPKKKEELPPLALDENEVDTVFGTLPVRHMDRNALIKFLEITKQEYEEEEIDALKGGDCVGVFEGKKLIFKK